MDCMVCGKKMTLFDTLYHTPIRGGIFYSQKTLLDTYDLDFYICDFCSQGQIEYKMPNGWYEKYKIIDIEDKQNISEYYNKRILDFYDNKFKNLKELAIDNESILDIGCATGDLLELSLKYFTNGEGIEPSVNHIKYLEKKNLFYYKGYFEDIALNKKYSAFICLDLLEHIKDIQTFSRKLYDILKENGVGYIIVPNGQKIIKNGEWYDILLEHISYFNIFSLNYLLQKIGFEVINIGETNNGWWLEAYVRHSQKKNVFSDIKKKQLLDMEKIVSKYNNIGIWGAGNKGSNFIQNLDKSILSNIKVIYDTNIIKCGKFIPNCSIKIQVPQTETIQKLDLILITALEYKKDILNLLRNKYLFKGKVISIEEIIS